MRVCFGQCACCAFQSFASLVSRSVSFQAFSCIMATIMCRLARDSNKDGEEDEDDEGSAMVSDTRSAMASSTTTWLQSAQLAHARLVRPRAFNAFWVRLMSSSRLMSLARTCFAMAVPALVERIVCLFVCLRERMRVLCACVLCVCSAGRQAGHQKQGSTTQLRYPPPAAALRPGDKGGRG